MRSRVAVLISFMLAAVATSAQATVIVTAVETGGDVVISGGGTLNLDAWVGLQNGFTAGVVDPDNRLVIGPSTTTAVELWQGAPASFNGPSSIGPGTVSFRADSGSGDIFGIGFIEAFEDLYVPDAYVSLDPLNGLSTWTGQTFDSLGLAVGTYEWTWGTGEGESFTLNIVPEPSTAALTALGLIGLASRRRRP